MSLLTRPMHPDDWPRLVPILAQSFNAPAAGWELFRARLGDEAFTVAWLDGQPVGACGVYRMGQHWLGRAVPLGGVAGVAVAPHARGRGVARAMMEAVLRDLARDGVPVAGLYPATRTVYRSVGYEQAGERWQYRAPLASLAGLRAEVEVQPVDPQSPATRAELVRRYRPEHGNLDRSAAIWDRLCQAPAATTYAWLVGEAGWLLLRHQGEGPHWDLSVTDLHAPDGPTARTLLALLASHRSLAREVLWQGSPSDLLLDFFPEPTWQVGANERWMLRLVNLPAALEARGWPEDASGELHLAVSDPLLPANDGRFVLVVEGGRARVRAGGSGALRVPAHALGPLYSGYRRASALAALGWLEGEAAALRIADRLFAAPTPWMREMY